MVHQIRDGVPRLCFRLPALLGGKARELGMQIGRLI